MYFPARTCAPYVCSRLLSYSKRHLRKLLCSCQLRCSSAEWILFPLFLSDKPGCATFQAHTCRARKLVIDKTFAQCRSLFLQLWPALFQGWAYCTPLLFRSDNQGCSGAGTRGNGVPKPFSCFPLKWVRSCFTMASFFGWVCTSLLWALHPCWQRWVCAIPGAHLQFLTAGI